MDMQTMFNNMTKAMRVESLASSDQLTIGELILKMEAIKDKSKPIVFDKGKYKPSGFESWRGSYCELAITYADGGSTFYEQMKPDCLKDEYGDHDDKCKCKRKDVSGTLSDSPTAQEFLDLLKKIIGLYMVGYKGGDFTVTKRTPVWVANNGRSDGFLEGKKAAENEFHNQAVVDVAENPKRVSIVTALRAY